MIKKLKELLATDTYTSLTEKEAFGKLHEERHAVLVGTRGTYLGLASQVNPDIVRRLIQSVDGAALADPLVSEIRNYLRSDSGVDIAHATTRAMIDQFAANVALPLTTEDATVIKALAEDMHSDAEKHKIGNVKIGHIQEARKQIEKEGQVEP